MLKKSMSLVLGCLAIQGSLLAHEKKIDCPDCKGKEVTAPIVAHLDYVGGPVLANLQIVDVLWGPNVAPSIKNTMPHFFRDLANSPWLPGFSEYTTLGLADPTSNQVLGRGAFIGQFEITPIHTSNPVTEAEIRAEIAHQINTGNLPAPVYENGHPRTLYMMEFPPGLTIIGEDGSVSCVDFCAFHSSMAFKGNRVIYAIQPDFGPGSGCDAACGSGTELENQESVHTHELAEAITDPEPNAHPAWFDTHTRMEIADICEDLPSVLVQLHGHNYTLCQLWSNEANACVTFLPGLTILSPLNFHGSRGKDEFSTQTDFFNTLKWEASPSATVIEYRLFEDGVEIATIPSTGPLEIVLHNRNPKHTYVYTLEAVSSTDGVSPTVQVVIKG